MRPVAVSFAAAKDGQALLIDRDTRLSYVWSSTASALVTTDPSATIANTINTPASAVLSTMIANCTGTKPAVIPTDFPLSAGEQIYLSISAAGIVQLFFTDPV